MDKSKNRPGIRTKIKKHIIFALQTRNIPEHGNDRKYISVK